MIEGVMEQLQPVNKGAEAVLHLCPGSSLSIAYHSLFGPHDDLVLLELDEKLLADVFDERVTIRGQPDEDAVLCTQSKTYALKFVGTSNSVLLLPPHDQSGCCQNPEHCDGEEYDQNAVVASVIKVAPGSMELFEVAPRLDKLNLLLTKNPYTFDEDTEMESEETLTHREGIYTWDDIVDKIQASNDELRSSLQALFAVEINGYWRTVDEKFMDMILRMLLHNAVLNDWSLNALNEEDVITVLASDGFHHVLARHCLYMYGKKVNENDDKCLWTLDERRVCVHFAREVVKEGKRKLESFMDEWKKKIPEGMHANFDLLEGEVLTEKIGVETWVRSFSVSSLPYNPSERFSILFKERAKWEWKDLQPYIRDLRVPGLSSEGLLLKYTRRTQPTSDVEPIFSAR